jgi:hypothetical protein
MQIVKLTNDKLLSNPSLLGKVTKLWLAEKHIERQLALLKGSLTVPATWFVAYDEKEAYAAMKVCNLPYSGSYPGKWLSLIFSRGLDKDSQCLTTEDFRIQQQCLTTESFENAHPGVLVAKAVMADLCEQDIHELYVTQIDRPSLRNSWRRETNMFNVAGLHINWDQYIVAVIPANTVPEQEWLAGFVGNKPRLSDVIVRKFVLKNALRNEFSSVHEFFQTA